MEPLESHLVGQTAHRRSFWHEVRAAAVLERVPLDRPATVADLGAGAGLLGEQLRQYRPRAKYRFYEPIDSLADRLAAIHGSDARLPAATALAEADLVTLLDVIEHIEDDHGFLAEIADAMRPRAQLVVTVPALPQLWSPWDEELGHHRRYTKQTLRAVPQAVPLVVDEVSYLFPELLAPALVRRLARGRIGNDRDGRVSEFPELPALLDRTLLVVGKGTYRLRRFWPAGTSLLLVAHRV